MRGALRRELTVYDILQKIEEEENFVVVVFYKRVSILTYEGVRKVPPPAS